uniref:Uncharacterized protein n=1 Tax=viral metagenome TaxID=1070528 RepID=A0A6C0DN70_9ZZZZ
MNTNSNTKPHILGALHCFFIDSRQIRAVQRLEPKVIDQIIAVMDNHFLQFSGVFAYNFIQFLGNQGRMISLFI